MDEGTSFLARLMGRSCNPTHKIAYKERNGVSQSRIEPLKTTNAGQTKTLMFDDGWKESNTPLVCEEHSGDMSKCPMEQERKKAAEERDKMKNGG